MVLKARPLPLSDGGNSEGLLNENFANNVLFSTFTYI